MSFGILTTVRRAAGAGVFVLPAILARPASAQTVATLAAEVRAAESAFAATMAARDLDAFTAFIADEAVFVGGRGALRGAQAVREGWSPFFTGDDAPFAWQPELVEVLDSGTLALSSGPVFGPDGRRAGTFNSVWRREADGRWRVVFDKGCPPCDCGTGPEPPS